jgi:hypothetical protein
MSERAEVKTGKLGSSGGRFRRGRVSPRDRELLAWIGRQRMVQAEQLAAREWPVGRFGDGGQRAERPGPMRPETIARLLRSLARKDLLESRRYYYADAAVWSITAAGLREGGLRLQVPKIDIRTYEHDLTCGWLCLELEREFPAGRILTEREIRAVDGGVDEPAYCPGALGRAGGFTRLHVPDVAVESRPGERPLAIEVELTPKAPRRLRSIMRLYAGAGHLAGVRYYVADARTRGPVERAIASEEVNEFGEFAVVRTLQRISRQPISRRRGAAAPEGEDR